MSVQQVTDATFEQEVLRAELPVLVDLYADWCGPCKQLSPLVESLAAELDGKLKVCKVDVDRNPVVAQSFQVRSIPMLLLFQSGKLVDQKLGLLDMEALRRMVDPVLPRHAAEVKPAELAQLLQVGRAVPVDLRDEASYNRTRLPGAHHLPLEEVMSRASELASHDGRIRVLYARGEEEAREAAERLFERAGVEVGYLSGGLLGWEVEGLPIERG